MVRGRPSSVTLLPTADGSPPYRFFHAGHESSATLSLPRRSSSSAKTRPYAGCTPSALKKLPVAAPALTRSARSPCSAAVSS